MISISKRSQPTLQYIIVSQIVVSCWYPCNEQENMKDKSVRGLTKPNVEMTNVHMYKNNFTFENVHQHMYMCDKEVHSLWMNTFIFIIGTYLLCFILYLLNMTLFLCDIMCTEHKNFVSLVVIRRVLNLYEF